MKGILIVAHAPLAHALRECALHVFPDCASALAAVDVQPNLPPEESAASVRQALVQLGTAQALVLTDLFGATPCNVARTVVDGVNQRLLAGVNLPMLLRALTYRGEAFDVLIERAVAGGTQGIMPVATHAPQTQSRPPSHDPENHHHQQ